MQITEPLVFPADTIFVPVEELSVEIRKQVESQDGDYALTLPRSRTPSRIVGAETAGLIKYFLTPKTIVEAVISYSQIRQTDPEETLDEAFPVIQDLISSGLLVPADSAQAGRIDQSYDPYDVVAGCRVLRCVQVLEDTEIYQVKTVGNLQAALKIARPEGGSLIAELFDREAAILRRLDGEINPRLLEAVQFEGRSCLILEWCYGVFASAVAAELRHEYVGCREELFEMCDSILRTYSHLHEQKVIHSDVHPANLLVDANGSVKIIDYGLAQLQENDGYEGSARGGVAFYLEPEYAKAARAGSALPQPTIAGEQYALAALLYYLLSGAHYLDFSLEKQEMLRQIEEDTPLPLSSRGLPCLPHIEEVLGKALSKNPGDRFESVYEFANGFREAATVDSQNNSEIRKNVENKSSKALEKLASDVLERVGSESELCVSGLAEGPICSVSMGAAGLACALYRMACIKGDASLLSLADVWSSKAIHNIESSAAFYDDKLEITPETVGLISPYHTASGVYVVQALISHAMGDTSSQWAAAEAFVTASREKCQNLDLTLGRSSTLLICSLLLDIMPEADFLIELGNNVQQSVWDEIKTFAPIQECSEISYLGIAHGWAGILYATLRWCQASKRDLQPGIEERLGQLSECAEPVGRGVRWKIMVEKRKAEYMPGWCNGSAGYIHLWTLAHNLLGNDTYLVLAERAAWNTWEEPKGIGQLCCGLAGRAYGLLNLYKHTGRKEWVYRAQELANRAAVNLDSSEPPNSLYRGEVGIALLAADLSKPEQSCMPFFESEYLEMRTMA